MANKIVRKPKIPHEKVFNELKSVVEFLFDSEGHLIPYSNKLWIQLSENLDGQISSHNLYNSVSQNRHSWKTDLKNLISRPLIEDKISCKSDSDEISNDEIDSETDSSNDTNIYNFDIPYRDYVNMNPLQVKYGKKKNAREYSVLKPGVWTNIVNDWFIKSCKIPCNIIYKRCKISNDSSRSKYFLQLFGKCKDCRGILTGWATERPAEAMPLALNMCLTGANFKCDHLSKRPLNSQKRIEVGKKLLHDSASNWVRNEVAPLEFGEKIPANIYKKTVLRKCKQEERDKKLGITIKCPIMSLIELKYSSYSGSIHFICADPFIVHYWTASQIVVYKQTRKSYTRLAIDATGGIVKKLKRTKERILSSHIFLYEGVISNNEYQVSVVQMISERQDTFTIYSWLMMWLNHGVLAPQETVTDYSLALLGSISRAFCGGLALREYVDECLDVLLGEISSKLTCYIRIDIAHLIKLVTRWSCWRGMGTHHLKEFYVRCTVLLINCKTIDNFKTILIDILTLSISRHCGKLTESPEIDCPSEVAKKELLNKIKGISEISGQKNPSEENIDVQDDSFEIEEDNSSSSCVNEFLLDIVQISISRSSVSSEDLNAYFCPEFHKNILRISKHFPLWSNVMMEYFKSPYPTATSASVEGDFAELKHRILRYDFKPMTADRFITTHLQNLKSSMILARNEQLFPKDIKTSPENNCTQESPEIERPINNIEIPSIIRSPIHSVNSISPLKEDEKLIGFKNELSPFVLLKSKENVELNESQRHKRDISCISKSSSSSIDSVDTLNEQETWMGLKNDASGPFEKIKSKTVRPTKYTKPCQEIDRILNRSRLRSNKKTLLLNGNIATQCKIKSNIYVVTNTCPFDSIAVAIAVTYNDYDVYKQFIDNTKNHFLLFSKELATKGPNRNMYNKRVELLELHFDQSTLFSKVKTINAECNVTKIIESYLKDEPSAIEHVSCNKCGEITRSSPTIIFPLHSNIKDLQQQLNDYTKIRYSSCSKCDGIKTSTRTLQNHLFIEADTFDTSTQLQNIPKTVNEKFKLVAVIDFVSGGHYVTYVYRLRKKVWELHNDLDQKINILKTDNVVLQPHLLMYVQV